MKSGGKVVKNQDEYVLSVKIVQCRAKGSANVLCKCYASANVTCSSVQLQYSASASVQAH